MSSCSPAWSRCVYVSVCVVHVCVSAARVHVFAVCAYMLCVLCVMCVSCLRFCACALSILPRAYLQPLSGGESARALVRTSLHAVYAHMLVRRPLCACSVCTHASSFVLCCAVCACMCCVHAPQEYTCTAERVWAAPAARGTGHCCCSLHKTCVHGLQAAAACLHEVFLVCSSSRGHC